MYLFFTLFKTFESHIYTNTKPIIDPLPPANHTLFKREKSTADPVTSLTQDIEDSFSGKWMSATVFVNLAVDSNTVRLGGLTCKFFASY